ncbi:arylsulfatase a family protein : Uncharacterized protein OS=Planctomyces brasiliensis (strain ATCC 49424 / DSM 5305 / JCM 21570 / NBRC 103401 / IFAM 1448) GN=Plabr_0356 PE=4 SV=1: DUF1501 [Gemmataceae bacterium]|nr:arylsulfatase a family protein : Uncharacterized protein OS=Planctomyces brasiliensis (strain ATCC 49424 / DSM 5305 / JCM 21570 / NBRC 103401 / IFAM 1448) GN=Plabr_0356 PE=4 SV=1: DUF1501 [Gemmataceae bacterium]VTT99799.1 arylsulfatase a family protein : Uncharacterized protein OS=Planctomyces brasiliensis (strain ATCC 49424 / DSM 5305 / JCM 21570 / NBRC 103401 / IFAM 1448) GN=Plabr_0356 PE=4 SV=1: DUF1501 [Gemmataceae bacterium]
MLSRRQMLRTAACGFGSVAFAGLAAAAERAAHHAAKAKRVIFLFMHGGVSQMDSFDYKPTLAKEHGNPLPFDLPGLIRPDRLGKVFAPKWKWARHGGSGQWVSELFPHTAKVVDKLCFLKGVHTDGEAHGQAVLRLHTGEANFVRPSVGSWVSYGLGTLNENLPGFVCLDYGADHGGERNYSNAFLPAVHQGTPVKIASAPGRVPQVRHLVNDHLTAARQKEQVDVIRALGEAHLKRAGADPQLDGAIGSFELAYRMQTDAPGVLDLSKETAETHRLYGIGEEPTDAFGRQCLLARRLCEAGVRFVQVASGYHWDHHGSIEKGMPESAARTDKPAAALVADLARRGLLDDTLVLWAGEFGRTPVSQVDRGAPGRDHNPHGYTVWLAGGGVKGGVSHGETDDFGYIAVKDKVHMHDLHATVLHLLGLDHEKLTYRYAGRDFRLTDVHGHVVKEVLA